MDTKAIALLMFLQMNEQLRESMVCSRVMSPEVAEETKRLFQKDYEKNHREDDDPFDCPYYLYQTETIFPEVVRLRIKHVVPEKMEVFSPCL